MIVTTWIKRRIRRRFGFYQAAPRTETPIEMAIPIAENVYGEILTNAAPHELASTIPDILSLSLSSSLSLIAMIRSVSLVSLGGEKLFRGCDLKMIEELKTTRSRMHVGDIIKLQRRRFTR